MCEWELGAAFKADLEDLLAITQKRKETEYAVTDSYGYSRSASSGTRKI